MGFSNSLEFQLDLNVNGSFSDWQDIRSYDYVALTALIQDSSLAGAWGGTITLQWTPDKRVPVNYSTTLSADGVITFNGQEAAGWVRAKVTAATGSSKKVSLKWAMKTARSSFVDPSTDPDAGAIPRTGLGGVFGGGRGGGGGASDGSSSTPISGSES